MSSYSLCSSRRINSFYISGGTNKPRCAPQSLSRNTPSISSIRENTFKHHRILFNDAIREFIRRIVVFPKVSKKNLTPAGRIVFLEIASVDSEQKVFIWLFSGLGQRWKCLARLDSEFGLFLVEGAVIIGHFWFKLDLSVLCRYSFRLSVE